MKRSTRQQILLRGKRVEYEMVVSKAARHTRIRVGPSGVVVVKPVVTNNEDVSAFLRRNESWIFAQLNRVASIRHLTLLPRRNCGEILFRGEPTLVRVEFVDTKALGNRVRWNKREIAVYRGPETRTSVVHGLENWLRKQARLAILDYLPSLTARINQEPGRVYVMDQRTKWGSCSSRKNLSFNWRLILAPDFVFQYLVTHEVVHLAVPDHSAKFWLTVQSLCPEMERAKQWLSRHHAHITLNLESVIEPMSSSTEEAQRAQDV